jgi:hypothetical protein
MAKASKAQRQARALCVELARVAGNRPMQYRSVRPIGIAAGLDDAAADAAIAYAVEKGWLPTDVAEDGSGPARMRRGRRIEQSASRAFTHSASLTDDKQPLASR